MTARLLVPPSRISLLTSLCSRISLPRSPSPRFRSAYTKGVGATPMSRLGSAWVMRHRLEQARALVDAQDAWCTASGATQRSTPFPQARENESLAALLRGEVKLNTHCYLTQDFESQCARSLWLQQRAGLID